MGSALVRISPSSYSDNRRSNSACCAGDLFLNWTTLDFLLTLLITLPSVAMIALWSVFRAKSSTLTLVYDGLETKSLSKMLGPLVGLSIKGIRPCSIFNNCLLGKHIEVATEQQEAIRVF